MAAMFDIPQQKAGWKLRVVGNSSPHKTSESNINPCKTTINLYYMHIYWVRTSQRTRYVYIIKAIQLTFHRDNHNSLERKLHGSHKYTLWAEGRDFSVKAEGNTNTLKGSVKLLVPSQQFALRHYKNDRKLKNILLTDDHRCHYIHRHTPTVQPRSVCHLPVVTERHSITAPVYRLSSPHQNFGLFVLRAIG
jgi:hypothetical protein